LVKKRILPILGAYIASAASAGIMIGLIIGVGMIAKPGSVGADLASVGAGLALLVVSAWWGAIFGGAVIAIFMLVPASLAVYYAELRRIRSWLFYAVGALLFASMVAALYTSYNWFFQYIPLGGSRSDFTTELLVPTFKLVAICAFPAIVAGTVYWWMAGRNAGRLPDGAVGSKPA
jgi:hypothetical protein